MFAEKIQQVINDLMPYIASHGGNITLVDACEETGVVTVKLEGACVGCPLSSVTLRHGLEDEMRKRVPQFRILEHIV